MPYSFEVPTDLESAEVIARLKRAAADTSLPVWPELRKRGVHGVTTTASGTSFKMRLETREEGVGRYLLRGHVEGRPDGTSRVLVTLGIGMQLFTAPGVIAGFAAWLIVSAEAWGWVVLGASVLLLAEGIAADRRVSPETNAEARFLCTYLVQVVNRIPGSDQQA